MSKFKIYAKSILIPVIVGGAVGLITSNAIDYNNLVQPFFAPPSFLFPIVWTILFIVMGISIYKIVVSNTNKKSEARLIYFIQLIVNALWTPIFFGFNQYFLAFLWILMLIVLVVTMILMFYKINKLSAYLNIPYLIWLLFACYLNFGVYVLN